jgi:hypothetical protein
MLALPPVWRGEHGPERLATRLATLTFVDERAAAETYAREPNNRADTPTHPTLLQVQLHMERPIFNNPDDPFLDFQVLAEAMGAPMAQAIFLRHADWVMGTNAWEEVAEQGYADVAEVVAKAPDLLNDLCVQIWPLLDDPTTVAEFRAAGFDGAIHLSSGATMDAVEYRVFDVAQVTVLQSISLRPLAPVPIRPPSRARPSRAPR